MEKDIVTGTLGEYDRRCPVFNEFTKAAERLVGDLLKHNKLRVHSIVSRVKTKESLTEKLNRPQSKYEKLDDITDICGIRIITFFADEVDIAASIISNEFDIDIDNSVDKRSLLDPDRFGYLSLHYIAKLSPARLQLTEYSRFSDCKIEIQIRSILQHTWAEIQHDFNMTWDTRLRKLCRRISKGDSLDLPVFLSWRMTSSYESAISYPSMSPLFKKESPEVPSRYL